MCLFSRCFLCFVFRTMHFYVCNCSYYVLLSVVLWFQALGGGRSMFYQLRDYSPVDQGFLRNPTGKLKKKRPSLAKVV